MKPNGELIDGGTKYTFKYVNGEMIWYNYKSGKESTNFGHWYLKTPNKLYTKGCVMTTMYKSKSKGLDTPVIFFEEPTVDL